MSMLKMSLNYMGEDGFSGDTHGERVRNWKNTAWCMRMGSTTLNSVDLCSS